MSVKIKFYNLPQSGWDLIAPLADSLPIRTYEPENHDSTLSDGRNPVEPSTYEITITVQLPALSSIRGLFSNLLSSLGVPSHNDNAFLEPTYILGETNNDNDNNEDNNNIFDENRCDKQDLDECDDTKNLASTTNDNQNSPKNKTEVDESQQQQIQEHPLLSSTKSSKSLTASQPSSTPQQQHQVEPAFVSECREFIAAGLIELCEEGVGGTYFIRDLAGSIVGVFKPNDEEPGAPSNPKDLVQQPLLPPGGGYLREVAAYLLDTHRFAGVPETFLLNNVSHEKFATSGEKTGSLQRFVKNDGASTDFGSNAFDVDVVHRIGLHDLRIFNLDRNGENLLVRCPDDPNNKFTKPLAGGRPSKGLVPIDHCFSLPSITSLDSAYFEWHFWAQAKKPFSPSTLAYIRSEIDIEKDKNMLMDLGLPESSILTMIVMSLLLKEVAGEEEGDEETEKKRWTLFDIANFVARLPPTKPSRLEELVENSRNEAISRRSPVGGEESGAGGVGGGAVNAADFLAVLQDKLREIFSAPPPGK